MTAVKSAPKRLERLPNHVAIVPDGNGRWAEKRCWPRLEGHRARAENMHRMVQYLDYHFTKVLWPDSRKRDLDRALLSYSRRERRFGGPG